MQIENRPAVDVIRLYDGGATLFYCDPPYVGVDLYQHNFTDDQFQELANRLLLPAWLAMWIANLVLGALGLDLTARACDIRLPWHRGRRRYGQTVAEGTR